MVSDSPVIPFTVPFTTVEPTALDTSDAVAVPAGLVVLTAFFNSPAAASYLTTLPAPGTPSLVYNKVIKDGSQPEGEMEFLSADSVTSPTLVLLT